MHLSAAALDQAIRLLEAPRATRMAGDILETGQVGETNSNR
jgi:hypothetical protein